MPDDIATQVMTLSDKASKLMKKRDTLRKDIQNSLLSLRTYNKVKENFPEAFKYLPDSNISTALTINLSAIRERVQEVME